ncbi:MAG: MBL fold metallo-hydrolase [Thermoleophilia bacterium]|nr:MBL fold metallo-hydrolase [Thermoleophilia bacterium]
MSARERLRPIEVWWPAVQGGIAVYLVRGEKTALIDTAGPGADLLGALEKNGLTPGDIDLVLATHGHPDHIGGIGTLRDGGRASIYIHEADAVFVEDPAAAFDRFLGPATTAFLGAAAAAREKAGFVGALSAGVPADRLLADGDTIDLGEGTIVRVVHLPGHTPGSVGFFLEGEGVLVAGDSLPGAGTPEGCLPLIIDLQAYGRSLERLLELPVATLHTTHPFRGLRLPPATVRMGSEVESYLRESLEFVDILSDALERQAEAVRAGKPLAQIADDLIDSLPPDLGYKRISDLPVPGMAIGTMFWNLPS